MHTYKVGDRVLWLKDYANGAAVRASDTGTVVELGKMAGEYIIRPDFARGEWGHWLSGWIARDQDIALAPNLECPCGIFRGICDYHRNP